MDWSGFWSRLMDWSGIWSRLMNWSVIWRGLMYWSSYGADSWSGVGSGEDEWTGVGSGEDSWTGADGAGSGEDEWTGVGSGEDPWTGAAMEQTHELEWDLERTHELERALDTWAREQCVAQTHKIAIAVTGSATDSGTTSETPKFSTTAEILLAPIQVVCPPNWKPVSYTYESAWQLQMRSSWWPGTLIWHPWWLNDKAQKWRPLRDEALN